MDASPNDATSGAHSYGSGQERILVKYILPALDIAWLLYSPWWDAWFQ
jgi:hypothetical protein